MNYQVILSRQAEEELHEAADWIAQEAPHIAEKWFANFVKSLQSLEESPRRCSLARENQQFPYELRQLFYGRRHTYRALFTIREVDVVVLSIRHTAKREVSTEDIDH